MRTGKGCEMSENSKLNMKPCIDDRTIQNIVRRNYDIHIDNFQALDGYDDLNFKLTTRNKGDNDGRLGVQEREYILKIHNHELSERPELIENFQKVMFYLSQHGIPVPVPMTTLTRQTYCFDVLPLSETATEDRFLIQLLKYIPGVTFLEAGSPVELLPEVGRLTGRMDRALQNFQERIKTDENNLWELRRLPDILDHIPSQCNVQDGQMGQEIIRAYSEKIYPILDKLQSGIIHGDVNNCNIIVKEVSVAQQNNTTPTYVISGLIDLMDACPSFYVYELATVMADIMASCMHKHNPLEIAKCIFKGYDEEFSLNEYEIKSLRLIICIRLLQSYVLNGISLVSDPENKYIGLERQEYIDLCRHLWMIEDNKFLINLTS